MNEVSRYCEIVLLRNRSNGSKAAVESPSQSAVVARNFEQNNMYLLTGWEGRTGKCRSDSRSVRASGEW